MGRAIKLGRKPLMQQGSPKSSHESKAAFKSNQKPAILEFARISKSQVFPSLIAVREWAVFWGLTEKELFDYEITLLRLGFVRHQTQAFADSSGVALHQLIMLCPLHAETFEEESIAVLEKDQIDPAIVALLPETKTNDLGKAVEPIGGSSAPTVTKPQPLEPTTSQAPTVTQADEAKASPLPEITANKSSVEEKAAPTVATTPKAEVVAPKATIVREEKVTTSKMRNHIVVKGDTLSSIARRYRVSVQAIKSANGLGGDFIRVKQLLKIPSR
jgi:LysM repeat protein